MMTTKSISIDSKDKQRVDNLIIFLKQEIVHWPVEARFVFAMEIFKFIKPEIDEIQRQRTDNCDCGEDE